MEPINPLLRDRYPQYQIGTMTYGDLRIRLWSNETDGKVTVGSYTSIGGNVQVYLGGNHRTKSITTFPFDKVSITNGDVHIGNDVWIGSEVMIMSGSVIGDGAVVGARSVVSGTIHPYCVVAGNPAKTIRKRFDCDVVSKLRKIAWWNFPEEEVEKIRYLLLSEDIDKFIEKYKHLL